MWVKIFCCLLASRFATKQLLLQVSLALCRELTNELLLPREMRQRVLATRLIVIFEDGCKDLQVMDRQVATSHNRLHGGRAAPVCDPK